VFEILLPVARDAVPVGAGAGPQSPPVAL